MRIVLSGGGTGGHITPILAVATELKKQNPETYIIYIGERKGKFQDLTASSEVIDEVHTIFAGKFRRYHNESFPKRLFDIRTHLLNLRDVFYFAIGTVQGYFMLRSIRPDILFLKGGFVGVPVGLAAAILKLPFVTHDSDAIPGLANRIVSRWARLHATGMPEKYYSYPPEKTKFVGVLTSDKYEYVTPTIKHSFREELNLPDKAKVLFVTGGSLGARAINAALVKIAPDLLQEYADLHIIHQVGRGNDSCYGSYSHNRLTVLPFVDGMYRYSGAADVVITRAGANTLAEFGVQGRACVVVPSPYLTGGHQLKNASNLAEQGAALVVQEGDLPTGLEVVVKNIISNPGRIQELGEKIHQVTPKNAAAILAGILFEVADV